MDEIENILKTQIAYYRARATEYDEWFLREGRYNRGEAHQKAWFEEAAQVQTALKQARPRGRILELACGTGLWTQHLYRLSESLTVVDASPEMLDLCRKRLKLDTVEFIQANLFEWQPSTTYDFVFFSFWLSHVPTDRFRAFWRLVAKALNPGGTVFFVDSLFDEASTAADHKPIDQSGIAERKLNDGRTFEIVKIFYDKHVLLERLAQLGWEGTVQSTARSFLYGHMWRSETGHGR
jgi:demethylmenaquinone methyltransferase/2-methoxy-6-polyprenyl-1,4-benzoquinol methylase